MQKVMRTAVAAVLAVSAAAAIGCQGGPGLQARYTKIVDPCQQERYKSAARDNVVQPFDAMVTNANNLDVTLWNSHFVAGSETLNSSGLKKLDYIARRPLDGNKVWIQTARDLAYDPTNPSKLSAARMELDAKRCQAVLAYLGAQPNGHLTSYDVQAHDANDPAMPAAGPTNAFRGLSAQYGSSAGGSGGGTGQSGAGGGVAPGTPTATGGTAGGSNR